MYWETAKRGKENEFEKNTDVLRRIFLSIINVNPYTIYKHTFVCIIIYFIKKIGKSYGLRYNKTI